MTTTAAIRWSVENGLGRLAIDLPPANATTVRFFDELSLLVRHLRAMPLRGVLVTGVGRHFSSGADLDELMNHLECPDSCRGHDGSVPPALNDHLETLQLIEDLPVPVVAAIKGVCIGSGFELALACHVRVAARGAVLGLPESTFGLLPGCGGVNRLTRLVGAGRALELVLRGDTIDAAGALMMGIVDTVVDRHDLDLAACRTIETLAAPVKRHSRNEEAGL